jgi:hypothetical protein
MADTRANQPTLAAGGKQTGTLYFVTDEDVLERWDGATEAWVQVAINAAPAGGLASARAVRTAGNLTVNNDLGNAWAAVDTGIDLTVAAIAGDVLSMNPLVLASTDNVSVLFDVGTIVSAAVVNRVSGGTTYGVSGWYLATGQNDSGGGPIQYVVQAGDISGGNVVLRLLYKTVGAANRTLYATSDFPLHFSVVNLGQV